MSKIKILNILPSLLFMFIPIYMCTFTLFEFIYFDHSQTQILYLMISISFIFAIIFLGFFIIKDLNKYAAKSILIFTIVAIVFSQSIKNFITDRYYENINNMIIYMEKDLKDNIKYKEFLLDKSLKNTKNIKKYIKNDSEVSKYFVIPNYYLIKKSLPTENKEILSRMLNIL